MKKSYLLWGLLVLLTACANKEVLLPEAEVTVVEKVDNWSPVYLFFAQKGKDTVADLNRKNTITSTNYIFNIDKRLPMRLVIPEVNLVLQKKEASPHKSEVAQNYFSYSDTKARRLAFLNVQRIKFTTGTCPKGIVVHVSKAGKVRILEQSVAVEDIPSFLAQLPSDKPFKAQFQFEGDMPYGAYMKFRIAVQQWTIPSMGAHWFSEDWFSER
ncbi:hypothetical protein SAMN05444377_10670 [Flavobacterium fontis]|uniref:Uncharacterized protein n=1 Tax=Flavobacterium fontis TaxID=1124188 RepID=A0A1M5AGU0_9FLAO|nr:hypothetical protein [Flavobacterium fontis]SHF29520.1 hypothetical protein SAMN05444377_10670 [Flavobacterium fontis]